MLVVAALALTTAILDRPRPNRRPPTGPRVYDSLTGCLNRRAFYERFAIEADRSRRLKQGLALIFVDLDFFKSLNDRYGHEMGDRVLQQFALRLQGSIRDTDLLFRWGGEEFVVLLAHSSLEDAQVVAARVRTDLAATPVLPGDGARLPPCHRQHRPRGVGDRRHAPDDLVAKADAACYRAKAAGRDAIAI